ncbi:hypothetical protein [Paraburkholderia sp. DGU8]|jgi:cytoskeletal protein RodZ|uniref:hypothetical protein n=1 Tax=Paraburkholderia sp. DGU8 TaxID=3161997 RepID=UPI003465D0D6
MNTPPFCKPSADEDFSPAVPDGGITSPNVTMDSASASDVALTDTALTTVNVPDTGTLTLAPTSSSGAAVDVTGGASVTTTAAMATTLTSTDTGTDVVSMSVAIS